MDVIAWTFPYVAGEPQLLEAVDNWCNLAQSKSST